MGRTGGDLAAVRRALRRDRRAAGGREGCAVVRTRSRQTVPLLLPEHGGVETRGRGDVEPQRTRRAGAPHQQPGRALRPLLPTEALVTTGGAVPTRSLPAPHGAGAGPLPRRGRPRRGPLRRGLGWRSLLPP